MESLESLENWVQKNGQKMKAYMLTDTFTLMFTAVLFTIARMWKRPKCPSIDK